MAPVAWGRNFHSAENIESDPLDSLIVDHENSPFHGKILLALWPPTPSSSLALR